MEENNQRGLKSLFAQVQDLRLERTKRHRLQEIIILALCGVLCGRIMVWSSARHALSLLVARTVHDEKHPLTENVPEEFSRQYFFIL